MPRSCFPACQNPSRSMMKNRGRYLTHRVFRPRKTAENLSGTVIGDLLTAGEILPSFRFSGFCCASYGLVGGNRRDEAMVFTFQSHCGWNGTWNGKSGDDCEIAFQSHYGGTGTRRPAFRRNTFSGFKATTVGLGRTSTRRRRTDTIRFKATTVGLGPLSQLRHCCL